MPEREPRRSHPGRRSLPENLPRVEQVIPCSGATCPACGSETALLGYDESEQLDIEPARYFVRVIKREKRVCGSCTASAVTAAPLPERIVEKGLASNRVVIQTVVSAVPAGRDVGARSGYRHWPGDIGRLGDASGRVTADGGGSDAAGFARSIVFTGR